MENKKSLTRLLTIVLLLTAVEALAAALWLLILPKGGSGAFLGYSIARFMNLSLVMCLAVFFIVGTLWARARQWISEIIVDLVNHPTIYNVISVFSLFIAGLLIVLMVKPPQLIKEIYVVYRERLLPLAVWTVLFLLQSQLVLSWLKVQKIGAYRVWKEIITDFGGKSGAELDNTVEEKESKVSFNWVKAVMGGGSLVLLGWFLFTYAGGTSSWDELWYMTLAMTPQAEPSLLNRYAHIYLLKLFFAIAGGDPFVGSRLYWAFVITATAGLVGFVASRFSNKNGLYGLIALAFFFTQERIWRYTGVAYADFSAMMWTTAALAAYLYTTHPKYSKLFLVLLGLFVFIAFKSTDLGIVSAVLWLGLGFTTEGKYSFKLLVARMKWVLLGVFVGQGILCCLDFLFLNDALFSLRGESWQTWLDFNGVSGIVVHHIGGTLAKNIKEIAIGVAALFLLGGMIRWGIKKGMFRFIDKFSHWVLKVMIGVVVIGIWVYLQFFDFPPMPADKSYMDFLGWIRYLLSIFWVVIGLFFISFIKQKEHGLMPQRLFAWTYPLALFIVVSVMTGVSRRYFLSAIPTLVILSSQFIKLPQIFSFQEWKKFNLGVILPSVGISLGISLCIYVYLMPYPPRGMAFLKQHLVNYATWDVGIYGVFALLLLLAALSIKRWRRGYQILALSCVLILTVPDIYYYAVPFVRGDQIQLLERRFFPLQVSSPYFQCKEDTRIFVSSNIFHDYGCFAPNGSNLQRMFKLYFQCEVKASNMVTYGNTSLSRSGVVLPIDAKELLSEPFDYIYLHKSDWRELDDPTRQELSEHYEVISRWWKVDPPIDDFTTYGVNAKPVSIIFLVRQP